MTKAKLLKEFMTKVWNQQRKDLVSHFVAEKYQIHLDPGDPWEGQILDHNEFKTRLDYSFNSFPDIHFELHSCIEEEKYVATTWTLTGTHLGMIGELPPTHRKIKTTGMTIYHFEGHFISGHTQIFDRGIVTRQLGFDS